MSENDEPNAKLKQLYADGKAMLAPDPTTYAAGIEAAWATLRAAKGLIVKGPDQSTPIDTEIPYLFVLMNMEEFARALSPAPPASGWRTVPVEPTPEMIEAGWPIRSARTAWERMIAAAPPPVPAQAESGEVERKRFLPAPIVLGPDLQAEEDEREALEARCRELEEAACDEIKWATEKDLARKRAEARLDTLTAAAKTALEPFVAEAKRIYAVECADTTNDNVELWQSGGPEINRTKITYGDLRRAVAALAALEGGAE